MDIFHQGRGNSPRSSLCQGRVKDEEWPDAIFSLFFSPYKGHSDSIKIVCLFDWPSSKQRRIDASAYPLALRPVLTNALLGGFVQLEWLQHLAEIYTAFRETGLSEGDGLLYRQEVEGSDPKGLFCVCAEPLKTASLNNVGYSQGGLWMHIFTKD